MSLMFQPGREVYAEGSKNFSNAREAMASPLAKRLFAIEGGHECLLRDRLRDGDEGRRRGVGDGETADV
jgi:hypothetical protein